MSKVRCFGAAGACRGRDEQEARARDRARRSSWLRWRRCSASSTRRRSSGPRSPRIGRRKAAAAAWTWPRASSAGCSSRRPRRGRARVRAHAPPAGVVVEVYASPVASSTRALLAQVKALAEADPGRHRACLDAAGEGAREAVAARTVEALVRAIAAQTDALGALGEAAGAPIVTAEVAALREAAEGERGTFAPSGAGGGDIAFFVGAPARRRRRSGSGRRRWGCGGSSWRSGRRACRHGRLGDDVRPR